MTEATKAEKMGAELAEAIRALLVPHPLGPDPFERASELQRFASAAYQLFTIDDEEPAPTDREIIAYFLGAANASIMARDKKRFEAFLSCAQQLRVHPEGAFAMIKAVAEKVIADAQEGGTA